MLEQEILDELNGALVEEKKRLEDDLERIANPTETPGDYETRFEDLGTDSDENATEVEDYADKLAVENDLEKQLKDVNDALERIEKGTYGFCENCQQEIDIEEGLKKAYSEKYDLVLLDLNRPYQDGLEILEKNKKWIDCQRSPILIYTSLDMSTDIKNKIKELGISEHIMKPIKKKELIRKILKIIRL